MKLTFDGYDANFKFLFEDDNIEHCNAGHKGNMPCKEPAKVLVLIVHILSRRIMTVLAKTFGRKHGVLIIVALSVTVFFFCTTYNYNVGNKTDMVSSSEKLMVNYIRRSNDKSSEVKGTRIATLDKSQEANTITNARMAQHSELVQQLSTYENSFKTTRNSNFNRSYGLSKLWTEFGYTRGAEVGVWKGDFSKYVLEKMPTLTSYVLVDSWRHLDNWNKPWVSQGSVCIS